jgi:hypothetical protein
MSKPHIDQIQNLPAVVAARVQTINGTVPDGAGNVVIPIPNPVGFAFVFGS